MALGNASIATSSEQAADAQRKAARARTELAAAEAEVCILALAWVCNKGFV